MDLPTRNRNILMLARRVIMLRPPVTMCIIFSFPSSFAILCLSLFSCLLLSLRHHGGLCIREENIRVPARILLFCTQTDRSSQGKTNGRSYEVHKVYERKLQSIFALFRKLGQNPTEAELQVL